MTTVKKQIYIYKRVCLSTLVEFTRGNVSVYFAQTQCSIGIENRKTRVQQHAVRNQIALFSCDVVFVVYFFFLSRTGIIILLLLSLSLLRRSLVQHRHRSAKTFLKATRTDV